MKDFIQNEGTGSYSCLLSCALVDVARWRYALASAFMAFMALSDFVIVVFAVCCPGWYVLPSALSTMHLYV